MEERSRDVIGLLEELTEQNRQQTASLKKQLFVTRILAAADYQSGTGDAGGSDRHATDGAGDADGYSDAV